MRLAYVFFDLPGQPYCGFEFRVAELLAEQQEVFIIPKNMCMKEGRIPIPISEPIDCIYTSNPMALDIAVKIKETTHKPLIVQFLDIPKEFASEDWRCIEYERVKGLMNKVDYITAISKTTAEDVQEWLGDGPEVKVNYLGVDVDLFQAFKSQNESYLCAVVRGLARQKQHGQILEALKKSKSKPPLKIIYGQFSDIQKAKIMSRCLFGIGMSTLEGFGLYVVEFSWFFKAFITRDLPVFREIYENTIQYVNSTDEMAEAIDLFIFDKYLRSRKGRELHDLIMRKELTLQAHAKRLTQLLEKTI